MIEFDIDREIIRVDEGDVFYIKIKDVTGFISKIDRSIDDFLLNCMKKGIQILVVQRGRFWNTRGACFDYIFRAKSIDQTI